MILALFVQLSQTLTALSNQVQNGDRALYL